VEVLGLNLGRGIGNPENFVVSQSLQANIDTDPWSGDDCFLPNANSPTILRFNAMLA
jgi:hypothetical protein